MRNSTFSLLAACLGVFLTSSATAQLQSDGAIDRPSSSKAFSPADQARVDFIPISDFSDGDQWTVTAITPDTNVWQITTNTSIEGNFTGTTFESPTAANGFALYNFDGATVNGGGGDGRSVNHEQYLTSPTYDISSLDSGNVYRLQFYHDIRYCCAVSADSLRRPGRVAFSYDGGQTFTEGFLADRFLSVNDQVEGIEEVRLPPGADTTTQFQVRFIWDKAYYYWAIDDIQISVLPNVDVELRENFFARAPYTAIPASQVRDSIRFLIDVLNNGANPDTFNVVGEVYTVANGALGDLLFTDTLLYSGVVYDSLAENQLFDLSFPVPMDPGLYAVVYDVDNFDANEDDGNPADNFLATTFEITDSLYSRTQGNTNGGRRSVDDDDGSVAYEVGNIFYTPNLDGYQISGLVFEGYNRGFDATTIEDLELEFIVYGFTGDLDGSDGGEIDGELIQLGDAFFQFDASLLSGAGDNVPITVEFDTPIKLDTPYIGYAVTVLYDDLDPADMANFFVGVGADYGANEFINTDSIRPYHIYRESLEEGVFDYDGIAGLAPNISIFITEVPISSTVDPVTEREFSVSPNPARDYVAIDFEFAETTSAVFELVNGLGQTVQAFEREGLTEGTLSVDIRDMSAGIYYLNIVTEGGRQASRRVMIER